MAGKISRCSVAASAATRLVWIAAAWGALLATLVLGDVAAAQTIGGPNNATAAQPPLVYGSPVADPTNWEPPTKDVATAPTPRFVEGDGRVARANTNDVKPLGNPAPIVPPTAPTTSPLPNDSATPPDSKLLGELLRQGPEEWTQPENFGASLKVMLLLAVVSLAPAVLLMTTSFVRIVVVLGLLRHALGTQQLPPPQVITSLALFMSVLIMSPVWKEVYDEAIVPYTAESSSMTFDDALETGLQPIRRFMSRQIAAAGNVEDVQLMYRYLPGDTPPPKYFDDVPIQVLLPAYMLSELKTAFLIGFQIYLPFLILDIVISSVTTSMGMLMLPPAMISLPFKLMLFVLVDGWRLVVGMLLESFGPPV